MICQYWYYGEWTNWTTHNGLSNNIVWAIRRQRSGGILAGTDNGLVRIDESGKTKVRWTDVLFAYHDRVTLGPTAMKVLAQKTGLTPKDL